MSKTYLGDSVYAEFDAHGLILTTENDRSGPSNTIYLEAQVYDAMVAFVQREAAEAPEKTP